MTMNITPWEDRLRAHYSLGNSCECVPVARFHLEEIAELRAALAAIYQPAQGMPVLPLGAYEHKETGLNNEWTWRSYSAEQVHVYAKTYALWLFRGQSAWASERAAIQPPPDAAGDAKSALEAAMRDALAEQLRGLYHCGRVWSAWGVGTMSEDDFSPAEEDDEIVDNFVSAAMYAIQAQGSDA